MDWSSVAGLSLALIGILAGQWIEGGQAGSLVQPAAFMIVVFGTTGAVVLHFCNSRMVFSPPDEDRVKLTRELQKWSTTARREGLLSLERYLNDVRDPFIQKGLRMIIDGIDPFKLRDIMESELNTYERQQRLGARVWESAGGYSPTVGILGAVLGLIHVMENLSDPSKLGSGIAVAFVATIYGVGLANLVFLPIGSKLKAMVNDEVARREMLITALAGIASGDNPRVMEERMAVF